MKTRIDGLQCSAKRFEYAPGKWLDRRRTPLSAAGLMGRSGVDWQTVRAYLEWYALASGRALEPGDLEAVYRQGIRERAERAAAYECIQRKAPDVARLMAEVRRVFGPRAGVGAVVELGGVRVWPVGVGHD